MAGDLDWDVVPILGLTAAGLRASGKGNTTPCAANQPLKYGQLNLSKKAGAVQVQLLVRCLTYFGNTAHPVPNYMPAQAFQFLVVPLKFLKVLRVNLWVLQGSMEFALIGETNIYHFYEIGEGSV